MDSKNFTITKDKDMMHIMITIYNRTMIYNGDDNQIFLYVLRKGRKEKIKGKNEKNHTREILFHINVREKCLLFQLVFYYFCQCRR